MDKQYDKIGRLSAQLAKTVEENKVLRTQVGGGTRVAPGRERAASAAPAPVAQNTGRTAINFSLPNFLR